MLRRVRLAERRADVVACDAFGFRGCTDRNRALLLGHAAPTEATVFLSLSPVTAILLGGVLLAEPLSPALFAAAALLALGLWLANRTAPPSRS